MTYFNKLIVTETFMVNPKNMYKQYEETSLRRFINNTIYHRFQNNK